jgi:hypothetical protein
MICYTCANVEHVPAYARHLFEAWNTTDYGEYSTLPRGCDSTHAKQCGAGEVCAKKQVNEEIWIYSLKYKDLYSLILRSSSFFGMRIVGQNSVRGLSENMELDYC